MHFSGISDSKKSVSSTVTARFGEEAARRFAQPVTVPVLSSAHTILYVLLPRIDARLRPLLHLASDPSSGAAVQLHWPWKAPLLDRIVDTASRLPAYREDFL